MDFPNPLGNQTFVGTVDGDTYHVGPGTGQDRVIEQGTTPGVVDTLQVDGVANASGIAVMGVLDSGLISLKVSIIGTTDFIILQDQLTASTGPKVEQLRFGGPGGATIDLTTGIDMHGTSASEAIYGSLLGDIYHVGAGIGQDRVIARGTTPGVVDVLQVDGVANASGISVMGVLDSGLISLKVGIIGTTDFIILQDQLTTTTGPKVEQLRFGGPGGATINLTTGIDMHGTSASEAIYGSLLGDTYHVGAGIGQDRVIARGTTAGVVDTLQVDGVANVSGIAVMGVLDSGLISLKVSIIGTTDFIILQDQLTATTGPKVEQLRFGGPGGATINLTTGIHMYGTTATEAIYGSCLTTSLKAGAGMTL